MKSKKKQKKAKKSKKKQKKAKKKQKKAKKKKPDNPNPNYLFLNKNYNNLLLPKFLGITNINKTSCDYI